VSFDETEPEDDGVGPEEDESFERPYGARPYGARPYGARPYGARPYGARPYGARPYGARPYGARPYGARPYGARPYGARPYGARPYGARPGAAGESLDPEEWSVDLANLFCEYSAVVRIGATVVAGEYELRVASLDAGEQPLRPRDNPVEREAVLPNRLVRDIAADPGLAYGLKADLAAGLASEADERFLGKIGADVDPVEDDDPLRGARTVLTAVRRADPPPVFRNAGWILGLESLDRLTRLKTTDCLEGSKDDGRSLDSFQLLRVDGEGGGTFLGYPFAISRAAEAAMYLAADWREAWIGFEGPLVRVDASSDAAFRDDETLIRAVMSYDFALRSPAAFGWAQLPEAQ
jgi:Phage capsid family